MLPPQASPSPHMGSAWLHGVALQSRGGSQLLCPLLPGSARPAPCLSPLGSRLSAPRTKVLLGGGGLWEHDRLSKSSASAGPASSLQLPNHQQAAAWLQAGRGTLPPWGLSPAALLAFQAGNRQAEGRAGLRDILVAQAFSCLGAWDQVCDCGCWVPGLGHICPCLHLLGSAGGQRGAQNRAELGTRAAPGVVTPTQRPLSCTG